MVLDLVLVDVSYGKFPYYVILLLLLQRYDTSHVHRACEKVTLLNCHLISLTVSCFLLQYIYKVLLQNPSKPGGTREKKAAEQELSVSVLLQFRIFS